MALRPCSSITDEGADDRVAMLHVAGDAKAERLCSQIGEAAQQAGDDLVVVRLEDEASLYDAVSRSHWRAHVNRIYWCSYSMPSADPLQGSVVSQLVAWLHARGDGLTFRVQAYPSALEALILTEARGRDVDVHPKTFSHVFYAAFCSERIHFGLSPRSLWWQQSREYQRSPDRISRAQCKLEEALALSAVAIAPSFRCVDVGASPGGWTSWLAALVPEGLVLAIDPADLHIAALPNVRHLKQRVEDCTSCLEAAAPFDVLVCDACGEPDLTTAWLEPILQFVSPAATVVLTIKCVRPGKHAALVARVVAFWESRGWDARVLWLLANTIRERTVIATKRVPAEKPW